MFCDETKIRVIAGKGGEGCSSFRREKYIPRGGPDGGDGGNGGNIILKSDENINTLSEINSKKTYRAEDGENGKGKNKKGKTGTDMILKVPMGTIVWDDKKTKILVDLNKHNNEYTIAKGGKGGLGNQHFATSTNQAPTFAENGEPGEEKEITLELRLVADAGLIGMPSVGKSTLISHISNARPKIASYEFTTIIPNLGVVDLKKFGGDPKESFVVADMPGLIEGASQGKGLGHEFLKHIARTSVLVHIIDPLRDNPSQTFKKIQEELKIFDKSLSKKPLIIAINKIDAVTEKDVEKIEKEITKIAKKKIFRISAVSGEGLKDLIFEILKTIKKQRTITIQKRKKEEKKQETYMPILKPHERLVNFTVKKKKGIFVITGERIEQVAKMTNVSTQEGLKRIHNMLSRLGIERVLKKEKIQDGDTVEISGKRFQYLGLKNQ